MGNIIHWEQVITPEDQKFLKSLRIADKWQNGSTFQRDKRIREQSVDPGAFRGLVNVLAFYAACGLIYGSVYLVTRVMR